MAHKPNKKRKNKPPPANNDKTDASDKEFDDDTSSDSDSDPIFNINNKNKPQNTGSCWSGIISLFSSCFSQKQSPIEINGNKYKIKRLIAEGGFSFVYLASPSNRSTSKYSEYAIKKMIIQTKAQMKQAKWEINVMQELQKQHVNCLKKNGIQINDDFNNFAVFNNDEKDDLIVNNAKNIQKKYQKNNNFILPLIGSTIVRHDKIPEFQIVYMIFPFFPRGNLVSVLQKLYDNKIEYMDEERILIIFIKICYGTNELHKHKPSWTHRDIKLDNILLDGNDDPYLMDFGSVSEAKLHIRSRKDAVELQEWAQRNMSGPYTAPEFFNCPSKFKFDERTDVWALGCLLYAMAFGRSPFDNDTGSAALAVLSTVTYPDNHPYTDTFIELIQWMLKPKLKQRPFIPAIIERVNDILDHNFQTN